MARGTIKNLVSDRGFGFIVPSDAGATDKDLFFHRSDVQSASYDQLQVGQTVEFDLGRDPRRGSMKATNVRPIPAV